MRQAPATKPSTVNVFFVVAFFLLKTTSDVLGRDDPRAVAVREDDRVERRQEPHGRLDASAAASGARGTS